MQVDFINFINFLFHAFLGLIIAFGGTTRIGLHDYVIMPLIILTLFILAKANLAFFKNIQTCIMSLKGPPPRVAQSAVIGQHAHSVAIGRKLGVCGGNKL